MALLPNVANTLAAANTIAAVVSRNLIFIIFALLLLQRLKTSALPEHRAQSLRCFLTWSPAAGLDAAPDAGLDAGLGAAPPVDTGPAGPTGGRPGPRRAKASPTPERFA